MKQVSTLLLILGLLLSPFYAAAFQADNSGVRPPTVAQRNYIIIIDVMGIGSDVIPSYNDVCINNIKTTVVSGQTIPLQRATIDMESCPTVKVGVRPTFNSTKFVDVHAWINCDGSLVLADIHLWGEVQQTEILESDANGTHIKEVKFYIPGTPFTVRMFPSADGSGLVVVTTGAKGVYCTEPYPNPCFVPVDQRSDDGKGEVVITGKQPSSLLSVQPNPFKENLSTLLSLVEDTPVTAVLMDLTGKIMSESSLNGTNGINQIDMNGTDLPPGIYLLSIQTNKEKWVEKVIRQ